jgi:hypothetical protein
MSEQNRIVPAWPTAPAGTGMAAPEALAAAWLVPLLPLLLPLLAQPAAVSPTTPTTAQIAATRGTRSLWEWCIAARLSTWLRWQRIAKSFWQTIKSPSCDVKISGKNRHDCGLSVSLGRAETFWHADRTRPGVTGSRPPYALGTRKSL